MSLFDWISGKKAEKSIVSVNPDPQLKPFGIDKPISDCSEEGIRESNRLLHDAAYEAGVVIAWRIDAGSDHKSTLFELAVDGMEAGRREDLPAIPEELKLRCAVLPLTRTGLALREEDGPPLRSVSYLALTREELEGSCDAIYSKKTSKKETKGRCYFCGFKHNVFSDSGQSGAAHFLQHTNELTREVVLGEELAADFDHHISDAGISAQQWIEQILRPIVLEKN